MKKFTLPKLSAEHILYGIAAANALRLAYAYSTADAGGNVWSLPGAFGLMLGAVISIGTAFISGKVGARLTKSRKALTWAAFVMLLVLEPVILAPITMMDMPEALRETLGGMAWPWAVTLALVPSLVLAGVAVANGGLVEATQPSAQKSQSEPQSDASGTERPQAKGKRGKKSQSEPQSEIPCRYAPACDRTFTSQNAANAHARGCSHRPALADSLFGVTKPTEEKER